MGAKSLRCTSLCVVTYHQHFIFKSMFDGFPYRKQTCAVLEKIYITASEIYFVFVVPIARAFLETKCSDFKNTPSFITTLNHFTTTEFP